MRTTQEKQVIMRKYGRIIAGEDVYVLLSPAPMEPEHYEGLPDERTFYVAHVDTLGKPAYRPTYLTVSGTYHFEMDQFPSEVVVLMPVEEEASDKILYRPIALIAE